MEAQEALNKICSHLLGKNWYIIDPICNLQANDIIYEEICRKYPRDNDSPKDKYRRKHPKCKFCHYAKYRVLHEGAFCECTVKEKLVNDEIPRYLCKAFELRREK